jgi:hypothetical protein
MSNMLATLTQHQSCPQTRLVRRLGENIRESMRVLINPPQNLLKMLGIASLNDFSFATSFVQSKLLKIPEVKDFGSIQHNNTLHLLAYIDQPNEDAENKIYNIYGELLDLFPNTDVDVKIIELYGRTKEDVQLLNL